ncbi:MAG: hypothetical protein JWM20_595 [Patescibacteria group bacterium]|nr:hypothetical protein [Patescibacteria group bacterium]
MGAFCVEVKIKQNDQEKTACFGIFGSDMSIKGWGRDSKDLLDLVNIALDRGVLDDFEFNNKYYFTYTGSHFQQNEEVPDWTKDPSVILT